MAAKRDMIHVVANAKVTTLKEQEEAFRLHLSIDERLRTLEELNRIGRIAAGYPESRLDRTVVHAA